MAFDMNLFNRPGFADIMRAEEEFQARKQAQLMENEVRKAQVNKLNRAAMTGEDLPAAIQEYQYFNKLTPEERQNFLQVKRANPYLNLGGEFVQPGLDGSRLNSFPVTPKPDQMPEFQGEQKRQEAIGKAEGEAEGAKQKKILQAPQLESLLNEADSLLPQATSGGVATDWKNLQGYFGKATDSSGIDAQLDVIGAALTSGVPRMEGPQSNLDVKLYEKAAGDLANSRLPKEARIAASQIIRKLNQKYMSQQPQQEAQGMPKLGEEQDGYLYIGGDPSNPASWRQK